MHHWTVVNNHLDFHVNVQRKRRRIGEKAYTVDTKVKKRGEETFVLSLPPFQHHILSEEVASIFY